MKHELLGRRIVLLTAHPDDEAFLACGAALMNYRAGGTTALICATLGERGTSHLKQPMTKRKLKAVRRRELMNSTRLAHIRPVHILGLPDAGVKNHASTFHRRSLALVKTIQPEVILTFGPDGWTGHQDHVACWKVGRRIARQLRLPLYTFTLPSKFRTTMAKLIKARQVRGRYMRRIPPYPKATVRITLPPNIKKKILLQHPSQLDGKDPFRGYPPGAAQALLRAEYFARVKA